jgi:hypothetical protein
LANLIASWAAAPISTSPPADLGVVDNTAVSDITEPLTGLTPEVDTGENVPTDTIASGVDRIPGLPK